MHKLVMAHPFGGHMGFCRNLFLGKCFIIKPFYLPKKIGGLVLTCVTVFEKRHLKNKLCPRQENYVYLTHKQQRACS